MTIISRGPFNGLVDDDGTGTTGSVWNKAAIESVILTPTDTVFGWIDSWTDVAFNASNYINMTVSAANVQSHAYVFYNKVMLLTVYLANVTVGAVANLGVKVPQGQQISRQAAGTAVIGLGSGWEQGIVGANRNDTQVYIYRSTLGAFPAGTVSVYFTIIIPV